VEKVLGRTKSTGQKGVVPSILILTLIKRIEGGFNGSIIKIQGAHSAGLTISSSRRGGKLSKKGSGT